MVWVDGGSGGKATARGPLEVRVVTLNTLWTGARGSACNITLDFNGLREKGFTISCRIYALKIKQRPTH